MTATFGALDSVALPVAETLASDDQIGAFMNADAPWNQTTPSSIAALPATFLVAPAQEVKKVPPPC